MTAMLFTLPKQRVLDANANPLAGALVYIFDAGTTTPKTVYTDRARTIAHTHPVVADADGWIAPIYPPDGTYKIVVKTALGVDLWTADDQQGPIVVSAASSASSLSEPVSYKSTTYSMVADDYGKTFGVDGTGGTFTFTVPSAVSKNGQQFTVMNTGTANFVTVQQYGSETLDGGASLALYPGERVRLISDGAQLLRMGDRTSVRPSVRQTVSAGPVATTGLPSLLPSTSASLDLTSQNVTTTVPLVVTAANGYDRNGPVDRTGISTANLTWSGLTPSATCYLYIDIGANGVLTTGHTTLSPTYQAGGTYSTATSQFTFNYGEMIAKVGNGTTAVATYRVYIGEATTTGSAVGSTVTYAYRGHSETPLTTLFDPANRQTFNHNVGVLLVRTDLMITPASGSAAGYAAGQYARPQGHGVATNTAIGGGHPMALETRNVASIMVSHVWSVFHRTTGALTNLTPSNWQVTLIADRGW